ncbi:MAG: phospholipase D family protein [Zhenhengia sp.]|uniref:phospholipase D family protein n=1 Tax=Zhenhengia sp. TaxID=2944208 RepID=UPI00399415AF
MMENNNPFYWNLGERGIKDMMLSLKGIKELIICSAYCSLKGVEILNSVKENNRLDKKKITVYLSNKFSTRNCDDILSQLSEIATVNIVNSEGGKFFHPKLYLIKSRDSTNKLILGSSNLTDGGLVKNIEMNIYKTLDDKEYLYINNFIEAIDRKSLTVDENTIDIYRRIQDDFKDIEELEEEEQLKVNAALTDRSKDAFNEEVYNFENQFFDFKDYEAFFDRNIRKVYYQPRYVVKEKMLEVHRKVLANLKSEHIDLNVHWNPSNITSSIRPDEWNKGKVNWLAIRFGKSKEQIKQLNELGLAQFFEKDIDYIGYQKHANLQYFITEKGFHIALFHAVPKDAVDRAYLDDKRSDRVFLSSLINTLEKIENTSAEWVFKKESNFNLKGDHEIRVEFDTITAKKFVNEYYKYLITEGFYSYLEYYYEPDDIRINDDNIIETITEKFKLLYPIYDLMSYKVK